MSKEYIKAQTPLPAYFPYPKFLLQMSLSHTARLTYVLLLDRMTLSQKNGWVDVQGRAYVLYPLAGLAEDLQSSISSVTRALRELEAARLIERRSNGFSKPNQVFLSFPSTAQKLRESAASEAAGLYRLGDAALDICKRSRAKSTDAHCWLIQHGKLCTRRQLIAIKFFVLQFSFMFFSYNKSLPPP